MLHRENTGRVRTAKTAVKRTLVIRMYMEHLRGIDTFISEHFKYKFALSATKILDFGCGSGCLVLGLWAFLGIRNEFEKGMSRRQVRDINAEYCKSGVSYWSNRRYRAL